MIAANETNKLSYKYAPPCDMYFIHVVLCTHGLAFTLLIHVSIFFLLLPFCFLFTIHVICTMHITYKVFHTHPHSLSHHMKSIGVIVFDVYLYVHIQYIGRLWFAKWIRSKIMRNHKHLFTLFLGKYDPWLLVKGCCWKVW